MNLSKYGLASDPSQILLSPRQVADYLGCSVNTLCDWRRQKEGPAWIDMGEKLVRYDARDLVDWLARNTRNPMLTKRRGGDVR